jgi:hypothetical protein
MSSLGYNLNNDDLTIPQTQDHECTFMVWHTAPGSAAKRHMGHASLLLRRVRNEGPWWVRVMQYGNVAAVYNPDYGNNNERYISFWPNDGNPPDFLEHHLMDYQRELGDHAGRLLANIDNNNIPAAGQPARQDRVWQIYQQTGHWPQPRGGQVVCGVIGVNHPIDVWGQKYQGRVALQGLCPTRRHEVGLNLNKMVSWAIGFRASPECAWKAITTTQNCAGVAVRAMVAGGADAFGKMWGSPSKGNLYITPDDAETYAKGVAIGIQRANMMIGYLRQRVANQQAPPNLGNDLYQAAAWKGASEMAWKVRGIMLRAIDAGLERYHALDWDRNYPEKLDEFLTIVWNTFNHMVKSKSQGRLGAFHVLCLQILEVVKQLADGSAAAWQAQNYYGESAPARNGNK